MKTLGIQAFYLFMSVVPIAAAYIVARKIRENKREEDRSKREEEEARLNPREDFAGETIEAEFTEAEEDEEYAADDADADDDDDAAEADADADTDVNGWFDSDLEDDDGVNDWFDED